MAGASINRRAELVAVHAELKGNKYANGLVLETLANDDWEDASVPIFAWIVLEPTRMADWIRIRYRCHICRLELVPDTLTRKLVVVEMASRT